METATWTCPWCEMTVKAPDCNKLRKRRLNHLRYYHPDRDGSKSDALIGHNPDVETSNLPLEQRNWTCPVCLEGLSFLGKTAHTKAVTHHCKTRHKRRKITLKTVAQARFKQYKTNPELHPKLAQGKKSLGLKLVKHAAKRRNASENGHNLVVVPIIWDTWSFEPQRACTILTCT